MPRIFGTAAGSSAVTGTLKGTGALSGIASGNSTLTGAMKRIVTVSISGTAAGESKCILREREVISLTSTITTTITHASSI